MITARDKEIIQWVDLMSVASSSQVERMFFRSQKNSDVIARRRLKEIFDAGKLKRSQPEKFGPFLYYTGKQPGILDHALTVSEAYTRLAALPGKIETWEREPDLGKLRPDAFCEIVRGPLHYLYFIEVERLTGNPLNQDKYEAYYASGEWRKRWPQFPRVLVITDKKVVIKTTRIMFIIIPSSMNGIDKIF